MEFWGECPVFFSEGSWPLNHVDPSLPGSPLFLLQGRLIGHSPHGLWRPKRALSILLTVSPAQQEETFSKAIHSHALPSTVMFHFLRAFYSSKCDKGKWRLSRKNKFICKKPDGPLWQFIIFQLNLLQAGSCPSLIFCCLFTEQGNT